jgi:hypothetical protein
MIRSTQAQKAERLKAARKLLSMSIDVSEAAMTLSRDLGLSRRQAYRYLEEVRSGPTPPPPEASITITLKMPASLAEDLRAHATASSMTTSEIVRRAVSSFLSASREHG